MLCLEMSSNFNTYYENIDHDFWRKLCVEQGVLRSYDKGDYFIERGQVGRYIGFVKSGTLKYVAYGADGSESVVGLEFAGEFVADFPFSLYGKNLAFQSLPLHPAKYIAFRQER